MARTIEYFFTLMSPWTYLGHDAFMHLAQSQGARIVYKPVNLGPVFEETGGLPLARRHPARQRYRLVELQRWRTFRDLPLNLHPAHWPFPVGLADKAVLAAAQMAADPNPFMKAVFRAIWAEDRNMGDEAELAACLSGAGLDGAAILERAKAPETEAVYASNIREAVEKNVFGAPSYVLDGETFWGQDRLPLLEAALVSGRGAYRPD